MGGSFNTANSDSKASGNVSGSPSKNSADATSEKTTNKKQASHLKILAAAGKIMREEGYAGAGLQRIMKAAGMTVGGFYAHFRSKEFLFAKVISDSFRLTRERFGNRHLAKPGPDWVRAIIGDYLSLEHRNDIAHGCPMPALLSEIPRAGSVARRVYEKEFRLSLERFRERLGEDNDGKAQVILAILVGGISIARAVQDEELASQILQNCREAALKVSGLGRNG